MNVREVLPPDAIPSVDDPEFEREYVGDPDDEVIVLDIDREVDGDDAGGAAGADTAAVDPPRAYPVRVLHYHEIVNDRFRGVPVAVTWCPLCGSAVVYDRRVGTADGERELTFGVSGKLADDDLVMYDRETGSEWKQSLGRAIDGPLEGSDLRVLPAGMTRYADFRESAPDGVVLAPPGGASEAAGDDDSPASIDYEDAPYERYFAMDGFGLDAHRGAGASRDWNRSDVGPKTVVLGVEHGGEALGFPLPHVRAAGGVVRATVGGADVVVLTAPGDGEGGGRQGDAETTSDGTVSPGPLDGIQAYQAPPFDLSGSTAEAGEWTLHGDGTTWDPRTGESADGRRLDRVPSRRLFAFAWQDDHGPGAFFEG